MKILVKGTMPNGTPIQIEEGLKQMQVTKTTANTFRKFLLKVYGEQGKIQKFTGCCIVKTRDNKKIDVDSYSDHNYAEFSGAVNSGTILTQRTYEHRINYDGLERWKKVILDQEKTAEMLEILSQENGVEAIFLNNKIIAAKSDRVIYTA